VKQYRDSCLLFSGKIKARKEATENFHSLGLAINSYHHELYQLSPFGRLPDLFSEKVLLGKYLQVRTTKY